MVTVKTGSAQTQDNKIKVFIASGGDLVNERDRAEAVLYSLNKVIAVSVEPVRWETDMAGGSVDTPTIQDTIDESLLKECEAVLVLFYSRVGKFTQHEFELALIMGKKVFVYFKTGYPPKQRDEIENLSKVLDLKESIKSDNRILFQEFDTIDRFENIFKDDILKYLKQNYKLLTQGKTDSDTFYADAKRIDSNRQAGTSQPLAGKKLADLDQARLLNFMNHERVIVEFLKKNIDTLEGKFNHLHLMTEGKYLVKGAYLCFGTNIPAVCRTASPTKFIVFETIDSSRPVINIAVNGHLLDQYFEVLNHLRKNLYLLRDVYKREPEDYEIPLAVIRELLANAYVHRDYGDDIMANIQVELYPDRLEITNPGNFPNEISLENLDKNILSWQRNLEIAMVFFFYGIVDKIGKGIQRVQNELKEKKWSLPISKMM